MKFHVRKEEKVGRDFYTFARENKTQADANHEKTLFNLSENGEVPYAARIAVYDDPSMTPRVVIIDPKDIHNFLEEITLTVTKLSHDQGGTIPFIIIREIVENLIHALFMEPTISILDNGNTIRISDQGPGIKEKELALEYGTSSATDEMKQYIRGVGSGLPNAMQYMIDKGGSLTIQDNIAGGTIVTISTSKHPSASKPICHLEEVEEAPVVSTVNSVISIPSQPASYTAMSAPQATIPTQQAAPVTNTQVPSFVPSFQPTPRQMQIIAYLQQNETVGPSELCSMYSGSVPTWSRELAKLEKLGLLIKDGQKRRPTTMGQEFISRISN